MTYKAWAITPEHIFARTPIIPVMVIRELAHAVPLAKALVAGGISVLEITLRTPAALDAIALIKKNVPNAIVGAGTVLNGAQLQASINAGAEFAISPGLTTDLLQAGNNSPISLIPGVMSISEIMQGLPYGYTHFKFFPAEAAGGVPLLKSIHGPLPDVRFCPTGGINKNNVNEYLGLPNVSCVGGSWILPDELINNGQWESITELCLSTLKACKRNP